MHFDILAIQEKTLSPLDSLRQAQQLDFEPVLLAIHVQLPQPRDSRSFLALELACHSQANDVVKVLLSYMDVLVKLFTSVSLLC